MAKHWMAEAFGAHPGAFKKKAAAAGKSTSALAHEKAGASGRTGAQARLALIGMKYGKKGGRAKKGGARAQAAALRED